MKRTIDVSLILPCYNEMDVFAGSVARIVEVLKSSTLRYEIIFVDDGSRDGTQKLIESACRKLDSRRSLSRTLMRDGNDKGRHRAIYHSVNQGRGKTVADGMRVAQGTVVGYIDIDCEVGPEYIPQMVRMILSKEADIAIGKRIYRTSAGSLVREVLSRGYQWLSDVMIGTGGLDTETGYKFFDRKKIVPILKRMAHPGWFWDTEIMVRSKRANLSIVEIPVLFIRRFDKQSSVHIVRDTWDYMVQLWRFRKSLKSPRLPK